MPVLMWMHQPRCVPPGDGGGRQVQGPQTAIIDAANRIVVPTFVSTLCVCIVRTDPAENRRPRGECLTPLLAGDQAWLAEVVMRLGPQKATRGTRYDMGYPPLRDPFDRCRCRHGHH